MAKEAIAIARQVGASVEQATAQASLGVALTQLGETEAGLAELTDALRLARKTGDVVLTLRAIISNTDVLIAIGRLEQAARLALEGLQEARRLGLARFNGPILACNATQALFALGRWDEAEQVSGQALETVPSDAASAGLPLARAMLELGRGDLDDAEALLQRVWQGFAEWVPGTMLTSPLFCALAELAVWRGELDHAKQLVAQAAPLLTHSPRYLAPLHALGVRVEADRAELAKAGHPSRPAPDDGTAAQLLDRLHHAAASPAAASLPDVAAWHATAAAERTRQDGPSDPAAWATAVEAWELTGQPYRAAYAGFRQAEALLAAGDRNAAAVVLSRAGVITGGLGARLLDGEIKALARRARVDLAAQSESAAAGTPTPAARLGLTPRETEVLALLAAGHSNRQIAQTLFISPKTASVHVSNLLAKLGVAGRVEAAAVAHRLGLD